RGNNFPDAAVCWLNALWDQERPLPLWAWGWLRAEARGVRVVLPDGGPPAGPDAAAVVPLRQWLGAPPAPGPARALAAFAVWAALQPEVPARLGELLGPLQRYLEASEPWLPVRAAWMARASLARLSGGDVLSLAQARDRIVARLREHGFSLDLDVPSFLRFAAGGVSERFQAVRDWLLRVRDPLRRRIEAMVGGGARERQWSAAPVGVGDSTAGGVGRLQRFGLEPELPCTRAYADLMLAWGLARLGEHHASAGWVRQAAEVLSLGDPVHAFLLAAFEYRIRQVQEGRPPRGPLPAGLLAGLAAMPDDARYKIDKLRERSRILEPSEAVDAFRGAVFRYLPEAGELRRALLALPDVTDGPLLAERARRLLEAAAQFGPAARAEAVAGVLDLAPRAGEEVALLALRDAAAVLDAAPPALRARLVERGLAVAADLGQAAAARDLAHRLPELIAEMLPPRPPDATLARMEGVARSVFRSLRRLGMTDETDALLRQVEARLPRAAEGAAPSADPAALRVLLCLSSAWFSRGRTPRAMALLDEARTLLFTGKLPPAEQTALALAYAAALGQAGVRVALGRLEELFQRLRRVEVVGTTNSHYTLKVLELIDTAVRSVADGDFTPGPSVRAWLDSEEFLTRRRIDRDLQALMEAQGV
ncbi:MAG TPA: hypothetical protein VIL46_16405, partial [Gemmataceae bacterium]